MSPKTFVLPKQWKEFLRDVNTQLTRYVEIHCLGGFVLHVMFDLSRPTADIVSSRPHQEACLKNYSILLEETESLPSSTDCTCNW